MKALTETQIKEIKEIMKEQPPLDEEVEVDELLFIKQCLLVHDVDIINLARRLRAVENELFEHTPD